MDFIHSEKQALLDALFEYIVVLLAVETWKTITHQNHFKSAEEAGKQQRIQQCMRVSQCYWEIIQISSI